MPLARRPGHLVRCEAAISPNCAQHQDEGASLLQKTLALLSEIDPALRASWGLRRISQSLRSIRNLRSAKHVPLSMVKPWQFSGGHVSAPAQHVQVVCHLFI